MALVYLSVLLTFSSWTAAASPHNQMFANYRPVLGATMGVAGAEYKYTYCPPDKPCEEVRDTLVSTDIAPEFLFRPHLGAKERGILSYESGFSLGLGSSTLASTPDSDKNNGMEVFFARPEYGIQLGLLIPYLPFIVTEFSIGLEVVYGKFYYEDFVSRGGGISPAFGMGFEVYFLRLPFVWLSFHVTSSIAWETNIETEYEDPTFVDPKISFGNAFSGLRFHFLW